jgi:phosphoglycerol transferase MdoB-like AlkP superfamily enzyme
LFFENRIWPRRCFSFPGACDLDMFDDVIKFFDAPGQRFFYWLTLNTHARYDARDIDEYKFDCEVFNVSASSESCRNFVLHAQFFSGLADALKTEAMSDVEVILVSDHSPILMSGEEKRQNFVEDSLPWVRIRGSGGPALP